MNTMDVDDSQNGYRPLTADGYSFQHPVHMLRKRPLRVAAVCLGLLCILLLAGIIGQRVHFNKFEKSQQDKYDAVTQERDSLQENLNTVNKEKNQIQSARDQLQTSYRTLNTVKERLQSTNNDLTEERDTLKTSQSQLQSSSNALTREKEQLKASRDQLQTDNVALTKGKNQLQELYNGMIEQRNQFRNSLDSVTKERDQLQNKYNNLTRSREQLQNSCNALAKKLEQLQISHNFTTSEKEQIQNSHINLTEEINQLQASYTILVNARDQLQESYTTLMRERDQLKISYSNVTEERNQLRANFNNLTLERDQLQARYNNITTERDQLQEEVGRLNATIAETCPLNWRRFQSSCYFTSTVRRSWSKSRENCQSIGADLAVITSQEEMVFVNGLYRADEEVWIGLTDDGVEGVWKWVDGTPLTTAYWGSGQPNSHNGKDQDCVEFWHSASGNGSWNDEICDSLAQWICEKQISSTT